MDSKGNLYLEQLDGTLLDENRKKVVTKHAGHYSVTPEEHEMLIRMNRQQRRQWFRKYKQALIKRAKQNQVLKSVKQMLAKE